MKIKLILVLALTLTSDGYAQSIVRSTVGSGGSSQLITSGRSTYFVSQSIGQAGVIGTSSMIRQGFQQPPSLLIIQESSAQNEYLASIFPNPFSQSVNVAFEREVPGDIIISILDVSGRLVFYQNYRPARLIELPLHDFANGKYIIHVGVGLSHFTTSIIKL